MAVSFEEALKVAKEQYPHSINYFEEYEDYYVFEHIDGIEHDGGTTSPIVIRKSDKAALNYNPTFFLGLFPDRENAGIIISEGEVI